MALIPTSVIASVQKPPQRSYKDANNGFTILSATNIQNQQFTRMDFNLNGYTYRKSIINDLSYIDVAFLLEGLEHVEVDNVNTYFYEPNQIIDARLTAQAYTTRNDWSNALTENITLINQSQSFPFGYDDQRVIYKAIGQKNIFLNARIDPSVVGYDGTGLTLTCYIKGQLVGTFPIDVSSATIVDLRSFTIRLPEQVTNLLQNGDYITTTLSTGSGVSENRTIAQKVVLLDACPIDKMVEVAFLNKFGRWECIAFTNRASYEISKRTELTELYSKGFNYDSGRYEINRRPYYNKSEVKNIVELETGFVDDDFSMRLKEFTASDYHTAFINGKKYYAKLMDNSWKENKTSRDGLKTFTTKLELYDYGQ